MDSTLAANAIPTSSLPLSSLIPPPPAQARDAARASRPPALYERLAVDTFPMLHAATASNGSAPEILPRDGCPIRTVPSDVLHGIVIELRKADSTLHGIREVERLRATCGQLRAIAGNDSTAYTRRLAGCSRIQRYGGAEAASCCARACQC